MKQIIEYDGIKFYLAKGTKYYVGNVNGRPKRLHRYVWEKYNGEIPKGYAIHHIDFNPENNDISNLMIMNAKEHSSYHSAYQDADERLRNLNTYARPKAAEWHRSEEGSEWHKLHYKRDCAKMWEERITKKCIVCGKEYTTPKIMDYKSKFCSGTCKATALRRRRREQNGAC